MLAAMEATIRILLIEDDDEIAERLTAGLVPAGFAVERADNGPDGYAMGSNETYDAAILDLGLPQMQGLDVLRRWRQDARAMPVLILTARGTWSEKVDGLNAGADDYITKPFHIPEVAARLKPAQARWTPLSLRAARIWRSTAPGTDRCRRVSNAMPSTALAFRRRSQR